MERLRAADLERVVHFGAGLAALDDADPFPLTLLEQLRELIGCEQVTYCELDSVGRRTLRVCGTADSEDDDATFWRLRHQFATCVYRDATGDSSARILSDLITRRQLHQLEIYSDLFVPSEIEYLITVGLPAPLTHTKTFLFGNGPRARDFGARERAMLQILRLHLNARYEHARARRQVETSLEGSTEPLVLLDSFGRAEFATAPARRLLDAHGLELAEVPDVAPLSARLVRPGVLLLAEPHPGGLTAREREVLALVAEGRSNAEIARALWISPLTVRTHLEHVYAKLGSSSRTGAVRRALELGAL